MNQKPFDYAILGAGSIGCYTGGWLASNGHRVLLIGRARILSTLEKQGLELESVDAKTTHLNVVNPKSGDVEKSNELAVGSVAISESADDLSKCQNILVAVKSAGSDEAANQIQKFAARGSAVVSLQNGLGAARILKESLPDHLVFAGMVTYNVVRQGNHFRQSTSGPISIELPRDAAMAQIARGIADDLNASGIETFLRSDIENVQWSKLLLNLNNGINALAGIPIRQMLSDRNYRRIIAACMQEALGIYRAAGIKMVRLGKIIPGIAPTVLKLPDFLFFRVASTMINIDPTAMTSLAQDLIAARTTEIDFLNGEIVRLARSKGLRAPINSSIVQLVKDAEESGQGSPALSAEELKSRLEL